MLHVIVEVDHDEIGRPTERRIVHSSGDGRFDNTALGAVDGAAKFTAKESLQQGNIPLRSQWMFSAVTDQWNRMELLLDPQFEPAGREVDELSSWAGSTRIVTSVRLVAVVYRKSNILPPVAVEVVDLLAVEVD